MHIPRKLISLFCVLYMSVLSAGIFATEWNSFIVNFDKDLYGKGIQTWQIMPCDDQWVYFANKNGMVQFDGCTWSLFPMNNFLDVRSVLPSVAKERIYVGGVNEFGFYELGTDGALEYHCMSDTLEGDIRYLGNVWGIYEVDNMLYLQGDNRVVKHWDGRYAVVQMEGKIDCSNLIGGVLYVGTDNGVWVLVGNAFLPLQGAEALKGKRIRGILPYREGVLVVTAYDGLYYCDGYSMVPFITGAEDFIKDNEVFCAAKQGDKIALGTIHKGVLLMDCRSGSLDYFNENNGLWNNTVLSLAFDENGNLWAGLDRGVSYISLNSSLTNLYSHPRSWGTGYTAAVEGGRLYLGTNRGLYYTDYPVELGDGVPDIRPVQGSSGQVWKLCHIGTDLLCLHDRGIFLVEGTSLRRITDITGAWNCQLVEGREDLMYVGVYDGIYLMEKRDGQWSIKCKIKGISDSCRLFEQESCRVLWIGNIDHVTRIALNDSLTEVVEYKEYYKDAGFPTERDVYVSEVEGKIYFATPCGIYRYDAAGDRMVSCAAMDSVLNGAAHYSRLMEWGNDRVISLSPYEICIASMSAGGRKDGEESMIIPIRQSFMEVVPGFETIIPLSDSLMIIPTEGGFAQFRIPAVGSKEGRRQTIRIKSMYLTYPKDSLVYTANFLQAKPKPRVDYAHNSVRFDYGIPFMEAINTPQYQYRLNGGRWSDFTPVSAKEYSNLPHGNYTFEVRTTFPDGTMSADSLPFSILPPWYFTVWAYGCYAVLVVLTLWAAYRWERRRVSREKQQALVEKDRQMHRMEQEYEEEKARQEKQIMLLEKEKLEHDLQHKSQELANLMINFLRKNEMLADIKSEILKVSSTLKGNGARQGRQQLLLINSRIDDNMQSDEVLARIEQQFDLIHNNFMKRLHARHPDLSNNECMMCAYLKMNLSTKEIAPLLNISVRGVETMRYRMRKKFGLEREDSLVDYLNHLP